MSGLAPWETREIVMYAVGDMVVRRDDPETIAEVIELRDQVWPNAICVRRNGRHGVVVREWWRSESADLLFPARVI